MKPLHKAGPAHAPASPPSPSRPQGVARATPALATAAARDRRAQQAAADAATLREGLTPAQLATLRTMETFKWELRFVRRPLFLDPVPVLFSRDGQRIAVLEADGSINENPGFRIRP